MKSIGRWMTLAVLLVSTSVASAQGTAPAAASDHNPGALGESLKFGIEVGIVGVLAVFAGLVAVYFAMMLLEKVSGPKKKRAAGASPDAERETPVISSEVAHAIALALFMDLRTFEEDAAHEITIRKITRPYSPWWHSGKMRLMNDQVEIFRKKW